MIETAKMEKSKVSRTLPVNSMGENQHETSKLTIEWLPI